MAKQEAEGQSFWTSSFSQEVRTKIGPATGDAAGDGWTAVWSAARNTLLSSVGRTALLLGLDAYDDLGTYLGSWL